MFEILLFGIENLDVVKGVLKRAQAGTVIVTSDFDYVKRSFAEKNIDNPSM